MSNIPEFRFDDPRRGSDDSHSLRALSMALERKGLDPAIGLYDEALGLAHEGNLAGARDRLRMLLCLAPDDGGAHLLLAKVLSSMERHPDAVGELDRAAACGERIPEDLRSGFVHALGLSEQRRKAQQELVAERSQAEVQALREEARRLRSDNARLEQEAQTARGRVGRWTTTTTVVSAVASMLLVATLLLDRTPPANASEQPVAAEQSAPAGAPIAAPVAGPVAAPVAAPAAAPAANAPKTYTVQKGDNLSVVAQKVYGKSSRWQEIQKANSKVLKGGKDLQVGMKLVIP